MIKGIEYKSVFPTTKDAVVNVDPKAGIVEGYFAVFGNKDSDGDILLPGAFTKTLSENIGRVKHLYQHDSWKPLSGTKNGNLVLTQDSYGLRFKSTISQTSYGRDVIQLYMDGVIDENSFGFQTIQSKDVMDGDGCVMHRELIEVKLWEGSSVTWGANEMAMSAMAKSMDAEAIFKKQDQIMKAIRNGKFENEDLYDSLEFYFKQLQTIIISTKAVAETPKPDQELLQLLTTFNKQLN